MTDSYIRSSGFGVGALVGAANSGKVKITDCVAEDSVSVESTYNDGGDKGAGGLVGYGGADVIIEGSAYEGTVKAPGNAGALAGNCWGTVTVKNSFAVPEMKLCTKKGLDAKSENNYSTFRRYHRYCRADARQKRTYKYAAFNRLGSNRKISLKIL